MENINNPQMFFCAKCQVYFWSFSKLQHPTHTRCTTHKTRMASPKEVEGVLLIKRISESV